MKQSSKVWILRTSKQGYGLAEEKSILLKNTLTRMELCISCIGGLTALDFDMKLTAGSTKTKTKSKLISGKMEMDASMRFTELPLPMDESKRHITEKTSTELSRKLRALTISARKELSHDCFDYTDMKIT